jgi:tetratricopeptide (TPR) repeat protein
MRALPAPNPELSRVLAWIDGEIGLRDVRGYSDEELTAIARAGVTFYQQGRPAEARAIFLGLAALSPRDAYVARAIGVIEMAGGDADGALASFGRAIALEPADGAAYAGRAEVHLALGRDDRARADLREAARRLRGEDPLFRKVSELLAHLKADLRPTQLPRGSSRE